ncbi:MAG: PQQ-binding-like beta-propeller repeat protein [Bacteroidetes bacterium]|nr:PQQ-binding-like beta-propeller repeat protein [Bacteroidota bacterium]
MKFIHLVLLLVLTGLQVSNAQQISEWREENRTGVSSETGLMKSWPATGPTLLWSNLELPTGYSSITFGNNVMFTTGLRDGDDILVALDMNGKILWQTVMGRAWTGSSPESRATPTVEGNKVYTCSGFGDLACIDGTTGKIIWSHEASQLNKGTYGNWGIAESLQIDGNKVYYSPGGPETMTIALNKATGDVIWKSASLNDKPGYVSPFLINYTGKKMIVNVSLGHVFAVDASNGEILWKVSHEQSKDPSLRRYEFIKCTTPLYSDGMVYVTGGYDTPDMMIKITDNGKSANVVWTDSNLDDHHGGVVLVKGYIYGSNWLHNSDGNWCCIDWNTGKKMWEEHWNCKGSIISAESMLYIYDEKNGYVGLLKATPEKFDLVSSFQVTQGKLGPFWTHPVIHNGVLYIRHNNALMAYNIKAK